MLQMVHEIPNLELLGSHLGLLEGWTVKMDVERPFTYTCVGPNGKQFRTTEMEVDLNWPHIGELLRKRMERIVEQSDAEA